MNIRQKTNTGNLVVRSKSIIFLDYFPNIVQIISTCAKKDVKLSLINLFTHTDFKFTITFPRKMCFFHSPSLSFQT